MTDLTDRMRTCAAAIIASDLHQWDDANGRAARDAADLLLEASNTLEMVPEPLGEPMALLKALPEKPAPEMTTEQALANIRVEESFSRNVPKAVWITNAGDLPPVPTSSKPAYRPPRVCPACDSRANKRVFRQDNKVFLACPVCAHAWEYQP